MNQRHLDDYLARIAYKGALTATVPVLHALTQAHAQSVPFENVDVLLGRPINLDHDTLLRKLVDGRRGGYCFELNGLFLDLLLQLGFAARPLGARVRLGVTDRRVLPQRTHMLLEIRLEGHRWITDVGVGAASLTCALRIEEETPQETPHDTRRLVRDGNRWFHQVRRDGQWLDVYEFTDETLPFADRVVANWYTSTHPDSHFRKDLIAARALAHGGRVSLSGRGLKIRKHDGQAQEQILRNSTALQSALRTHFGITVTLDEASSLFEGTVK